MAATERVSSPALLAAALSDLPAARRRSRPATSPALRGRSSGAFSSNSSMSSESCRGISGALVLTGSWRSEAMRIIVSTGLAARNGEAPVAIS